MLMTKEGEEKHLTCKSSTDTLWTMLTNENGITFV